MRGVNDEELIRKYLLGDVTPKEQDEIQDRLFSESDLVDQLLIIETELTDDYLLGNLTPLQRTQFENYFLRAPERQRKLRIGELLKKASGSHAKEDPIMTTGYRSRSLPWIWVLFNLRIAVSVAAIILATILLWLLRDRQSLKDQITELRAQQDSKQKQQEYAREGWQQLAEERAHNQDLQIQIRKEQQQLDLLGARIKSLEKNQSEETRGIAKQRRSTSDQGEQFIGSARPKELLPDQSRSTGTTNLVQIEAGARELLLQLNLEEDKYPSYRVEVRNADNQKIWSRSGINTQQISDRRAVIVKIPARAFTAGDYIIMVRGAKPGGQFARVDSYQFKLEIK